MKVEKVVQMSLKNESNIYTLAILGVVTFLAVSSTIILNTLQTRELRKDLEDVRKQVQTHQDDIRMLHDLLNIGISHRRKRNVNCDNLPKEETLNMSNSELPQFASTKMVPVSTTERQVEHKRKKYHGKKSHNVLEEASPEPETEKMPLNSQFSTKNLVTESPNIKHRHKKHHRHQGKKHHKKEDVLVKPENIKFPNQNFNTPSLTTTEESSSTPAYFLTLSASNDTLQPSNVKYITKRSYDSYDRYPSDNSPELSPYTDEGVVMDTQSRETRSRNTYVPSKNARRKPPPSIHLSGDTSRYQLGVHENYKGNGHLRHPNTRFVDWVPSNWVRQTGMLHNHFEYSDGYLTIKETGIYLVYAQVHYYDQHDENAFRVYRNGQWFLQCTAAAHSVNKTLKGSSCYTAAAEYLYENDKIHIADIVHDRYSVFGTGLSFFGVIKIQ